MRVFLAVCFFFCIQTLSAQRLSNNSFQWVNSGNDELNPVVSPDGRTLYITIANHPDNMGGKKDQGDIWFSVLTETNEWSVPVHAGTDINSAQYNAVAGFSASGDQMFLLTHYYPPGAIPRTQGISVSVNKGNGWTKPQNITIPYFQNKSSVLSGYMLPDQSVFVYAAETYGTRGVEDIYVTLKEPNGNWSAPKNLGSTINTQFQELSPSLSADGKTLYFSSNGRQGYGSFDIYSSVRLDDTWMNWSTPVNLGSPFNSEGRELYFRNYEAVGYALYASTKNSDGYGDIRIFLADEPRRQDTTLLTVNRVDTTVQIVPLPRDPVLDKNFRIYGKVSDSKTGEPIVATIHIASPSETTTIQATTQTGYTIEVPSTDDYTISIEAHGYVSTMEKLDVHTYEMKALEMNFKLQPVAVGTTVNLKDVLFEQGKTTLLTPSYPALDLVVSFLKSNPKVRIELAGHTDNRGIPAQNVKLSQARVDKVKEYLVSQGIEKRRISGKGHGGANPIASNDNEETRQLNRRVEFTIKKF